MQPSLTFIGDFSIIITFSCQTSRNLFSNNMDFTGVLFRLFSSTSPYPEIAQKLKMEEINSKY